jgi:transcription elongation factor GreA
MKEKILLTKEKKEALELELKNLIEVKKPEISSALAYARQNDLSEDTDDLSVMLQEKEVIEDRIKELKNLLANSKVIEKKACNPNFVGVGTEIKVEFNGKKQDLKLVTTLESDPLKGYISEGSPLGKALLKAQVGKTVDFKVKGRKFEYKILEIC